LCKAETTKEQRLDWFLKSLVFVIAKDVASTFPQTEEEAIIKAQQFDLIYAQSGYLYIVLHDAPRPIPFGQDKPGMSHAVDGLIGSMMHHNPYNQPPPIYGEPHYPQPYGGPYYYPPLTYQQSYTVVPPQSLGVLEQILKFLNFVSLANFFCQVALDLNPCVAWRKIFSCSKPLTFHHSLQASLPSKSQILTSYFSRPFHLSLFAIPQSLKRVLKMKSFLCYVKPSYSSKKLYINYIVLKLFYIILK
jgi:hypothetical protein